MADDSEIAVVLMAMAYERGAGKTFCPSEAARRLDATGWRDLMPKVRQVAEGLPLAVTQKGALVDITTARGPIRLGLPK